MAKVEETLNAMERHKNRAENLITVITNTGMVGGYQRIANQEQSAARVWHAIAILSLFGLIGFAIFAFKSTLSEQVNWAQVAAKAFVSITFGITAAYAARQADKHETAERRNRKMELELASIDPYLIDLPQEKQHEIKESLASRLFAQIDSEANQLNSKTSGSVIDLLKMALNAIQDLSKGR